MRITWPSFRQLGNCACPLLLPEGIGIYTNRVGWASPTTRGFGRHTLVGDAHPCLVATVIHAVLFKALCLTCIDIYALGERPPDPHHGRELGPGTGRSLPSSSPSGHLLPQKREKESWCGLRPGSWLGVGVTTAWMHDSRDGGGRAASGTAAEEVGQRMEQLPRAALAAKSDHYC